MVTALVAAAGLCASFSSGHADVPTAADIAACNREAQEQFRSRSVSPNAEDRSSADAARRDREPTATAPGQTGKATQSADPQIHGMDAAGAENAAYRAAYRVCMRRKGF